MLIVCVCVCVCVSVVGCAEEELDWRKCKAIAQALSSSPSQAISLQDYHSLLSPQVSAMMGGGEGKGGDTMCSNTSVWGGRDSLILPHKPASQFGLRSTCSLCVD